MQTGCAVFARSRYCAGIFASKPIEQVVAEAQEWRRRRARVGVGRAGHNVLCLTLTANPSWPRLLRRLEEMTGLAWNRLMYLSQCTSPTIDRRESRPETKCCRIWISRCNTSTTRCWNACGGESPARDPSGCSTGSRADRLTGAADHDAGRNFQVKQRRNSKKTVELFKRGGLSAWGVLRLLRRTGYFRSGSLTAICPRS